MDKTMLKMAGIAAFMDALMKNTRSAVYKHNNARSFPYHTHRSRTFKKIKRAQMKGKM